MCLTLCPLSGSTGSLQAFPGLVTRGSKRLPALLENHSSLSQHARLHGRSRGQPHTLRSSHRLLQSADTLVFPCTEEEMRPREATVLFQVQPLSGVEWVGESGASVCLAVPVLLPSRKLAFVLMGQAPVCTSVFTRRLECSLILSRVAWGQSHRTSHRAAFEVLLFWTEPRFCRELWRPKGRQARI